MWMDFGVETGFFYSPNEKRGLSLHSPKNPRPVPWTCCLARMLHAILVCKIGPIKNSYYTRHSHNNSELFPTYWTTIQMVCPLSHQSWPFSSLSRGWSWHFRFAHRKSNFGQHKTGELQCLRHVPGHRLEILVPTNLALHKHNLADLLVAISERNN